MIHVGLFKIDITTHKIARVGRTLLKIVQIESCVYTVLTFNKCLHLVNTVMWEKKYALNFFTSVYRYRLSSYNGVA